MTTRDKARGKRLTRRERQVIKAILAGNTTYQMIADALVLSESTVRGHLNNIYNKTDAINMVDLVLMVLGRKEWTAGGNNVTTGW